MIYILYFISCFVKGEQCKQFNPSFLRGQTNMLKIIFHFKMKRIKHQKICITDKNKPLFRTFQIYNDKLMLPIIYAYLCK